MTHDLLHNLTALDFMATDLQLYLNTHPNDKEAISKYNEVIIKADKCRMEYEKLHGPLCSFRSHSNNDCFKWIDEPWPWQRKFNCDSMEV